MTKNKYPLAAMTAARGYLLVSFYRIEVNALRRIANSVGYYYEA